MINFAVDIWVVVSRWRRPELHIGVVSNGKVIGALGKGQLHQKLHVVVTACICGLVKLSEAWIRLVVPLIDNVIVFLGSQIREFGVAVEPFFESQAAPANQQMQGQLTFGMRRSKERGNDTARSSRRE